MKKIVLIVIAFMAVHTVNAQNVYIPDPEFKAEMLKYFDENKDGEVQVSEANAYSSPLKIKIEGVPGIEDVTGIENFKHALTTLELKDLDITTVDLTGMTKLTELNLDGSKKVNTLDLSPCENLVTLRATNCAIEDLDLTVAPKLQRAYIRFNVLNTLKLPSTTLTALQIDGGNFTTDIDLSGNTNMVYLYIQNVTFSTLDLRNGNNGKLLDRSITLKKLGANTCVAVSDTFVAKGWTTNVDSDINFKLQCGSSSASIKEVVKAIKVYPNPATTRLNISDLQGQAEVSIYNLIGREVLQINSTQNIDLSTLPKGVYTLKIMQDGTLSQAKFIKN